MNTRNHSYYRYASYATPSATWSYDTVEQVVTLFWKQNAKQITYRQGNKHFEEHRARIIRRANTYGIA
jgi:hypothetical protein